MTLGHRVLPQDGFPIVGFPERRPNLYIAALHSAMTMGPIIGQLAAMEILDGVEVDLFAPYRLSRFDKGAASLAPGQSIQDEIDEKPWPGRRPVLKDGHPHPILRPPLTAFTATGDDGSKFTTITDAQGLAARV
jgi:hypothetical protein